MRQMVHEEKTAVVHGMAEQAMSVASCAARSSTRSEAHLNALQRQLADRGSELNEKAESTRQWREEVEQRMRKDFQAEVRKAAKVEARRMFEEHLSLLQSSTPPTGKPPGSVKFEDCFPAAHAPTPAQVESAVPALPYPEVPTLPAVKIPSAPSPSALVSVHREPDAEVSLGHSVPRSRVETLQNRKHQSPHEQLSAATQPAYEPSRVYLQRGHQRTAGAESLPYGASTPVLRAATQEEYDQSRALPVQESSSEDTEHVVRAQSPETFGRQAVNRKESETSPSYDASATGTVVAASAGAAFAGAAVGQLVAAGRTPRREPP